ncbi:MAG: hypothetical protein D6740_11215 [Alphaproteobacteria bacterium]|nr:MAG: hypothetical protein D6740_11215 [Alphaproteobacteria bacterium]
MVSPGNHAGSRGRFVVHALGALALVHDRRYAQNHVLDVVSAGLLVLDPAGSAPLEVLQAALGRELDLPEGEPTLARLRESRRRLAEIGLLTASQEEGGGR